MLNIMYVLINGGHIPPEPKPCTAGKRSIYLPPQNPKFINSNLHVAVHGNYLTWSFASYMSIVFLNQLHVLSTYLTTYCIGCGLILVLVKNFFRPVYFFFKPVR